MSENIKRILIVDDNEKGRTLLGRLLTPFGKIESIGSGEEALEMVRSGNHYDLLILDILLPGMDGFQTASAIRSNRWDGPIIYTSAEDLTLVQKETISEDGDVFCSKPIDIDELEILLGGLFKTEKV